MSLEPVAEAFLAWIDVVARALLAAAGKLRTPRRVRLIEDNSDLFKIEVTKGREPARSLAERVRIIDHGVRVALPTNLAAELRGSRIELVMKHDRFLFRPLELPKRATEFLHGIVRAQIDRLTPWNTNDAVFGWTPPDEIGKDRILLTVVATTRALILPYLTALTEAGAQMIVVSTTPPAANPAPVIVLEYGARGEIGIRRIRVALATAFVAMAISAGIATTAAQFATDALEAQRLDLSQRISQHSASLLREGAGTPSEQNALERRKRETPSSVLLIEALSQVLPDHTYVTELHIEGDKLQVIGITRDAPSLIRLIEQSAHFTRATFFAPTTRTTTDPGERFHIEAHINPVFDQRT
jgi:general secretion pathway protein L